MRSGFTARFFTTRAGSACGIVPDRTWRFDRESEGEYKRRQSQTLKGVDGFRLQPRRDGERDLSALKGRLVRPRFRLKNATLYAFQIKPWTGW